MPRDNERRRHQRYYVEWPATLEDAESGKTFTGQGRDVSRGGALVEMFRSEQLEEGQRLNVHFHPPLTSALAQTALRDTVSRKARVARLAQGAYRLTKDLQKIGLEFEDD